MGPLGDGKIQLQMFCKPGDAPDIVGVYDPTTGHFTNWHASAMNWSASHSGSMCTDSGTVCLLGYGANDQYGLTLSGFDTNPGAGPWRVKVAAAMGTTVSACPARPGGSPIPAADPTSMFPGYGWTDGAGNTLEGVSQCLVVTVDGEPCDPSPYIQGSEGNTMHSDGAGVITRTGGSGWRHGNVGHRAIINGVTYTISGWTGDAEMAIACGGGNPACPTTGDYTGNTTGDATHYVIQSDTIDPGGKCGVSLDAYVQDAKVGDILYAYNGSTPKDISVIGGLDDTVSEPMRLLIKSGTTWTMQRAFGNHTILNWTTNTYMYESSPALNIVKPVPSGEPYATMFWDYGTEAISIIGKNNFAGHGFGAPGVNVSLLSGATGGTNPCDVRTTWNGEVISNCYTVHQGATLNDVLNSTVVSLAGPAPAFGGQNPTGNGNGSETDDHSSYNFYLKPKNFAGYLVDHGKSLPSGGTNVTGSLWKYTYTQRGCSSAQQCLNLEKVLPLFAYVGTKVTTDISSASTGDVITGTAADAYKRCSALAVNECRTGSAVGDLYVNAFGSSTGVGLQSNAIDTIDSSSYFGGGFYPSLMQRDFQVNDLNGTRARLLTRLFRTPKIFTVYDNTRHLTDGGALFSTVPNLEGRHSPIIMTLLPPLDLSQGAHPRNDFWPTPFVIPAGPGGTVNARLVFGYAEYGAADAGYCNERAEKCLFGDSSTPYSYASEGNAGLSCAAGCTINAPGRPGYAVYGFAEYLNSGGSVIGTSGLDVHIADPVTAAATGISNRINAGRTATFGKQ